MDINIVFRRLFSRPQAQLSCQSLAPPVDLPQTVTGVQENREILNVRDDGWRGSHSILDFSFELWPARVEIPRTTISWSAWSPLECATQLNFRDLTKIDQNHDVGQNFKIFSVLIAVNHYKRFLLRLGFVWDVVDVFRATTLVTMFGKWSKSRKFHSQRNWKQ